MNDVYATQRDVAEEAALRTRVGRDAARGPTAFQELGGLISAISVRADELGSNLEDLANRSLGAVPEVASKSGELRAGPSHGGEVAELFYALHRLDDFIDRARAAQARLEALA